MRIEKDIQRLSCAGARMIFQNHNSKIHLCVAALAHQYYHRRVRACRDALSRLSSPHIRSLVAENLNDCINAVFGNLHEDDASVEPANYPFHDALTHLTTIIYGNDLPPEPISCEVAARESSAPIDGKDMLWSLIVHNYYHRAHPACVMRCTIEGLRGLHIEIGTTLAQIHDDMSTFGLEDYDYLSALLRSGQRKAELFMGAFEPPFQDDLTGENPMYREVRESCLEVYGTIFPEDTT